MVVPKLLTRAAGALALLAALAATQGALSGRSSLTSEPISWDKPIDSINYTPPPHRSQISIF